MLAASSSSSSSSSQPPQPSQQSPQLTQPPHQRPNLTQQDWAQREKQKQQGEEAGEPEEYGKKGDEAPETQLQQDRGGSRPGAEAPGKVFLLQGGQLRNPRQRTVVPGVLISSTAPGGGCGSGGSSGGSSSRRVADVALPRNTSWVVPGVLAGGSTPKNADQITALYSLGVGLIITLTEEEPLPPDWFVAASSDGAAGSKTHPGPYGRGGGDGGDGAATALTAASRVRNIFVPVTNYEPPTVQQMDEVLAAIEDHQVTAVAAAAAAATGAPATAVVATAAAAMDVAAAAAPAVLVHCGGGKGRAGTVLACYLCKYGQAPPPLGTTAAAAAAAAAQQPEAEALPRTAADTTAAVRNVLMAPPAMSADAAVRLIRELRPGSIETEQQRRFVGQYCDMLWRRYDRANAESTAEMDVAVAAGSAAAGLPPILAATATGPTLPGEATIAAGAAGAAAPSASPHQTQQQQQQPLSHSQTRRTRAPNQATPPPHFRHLPRLVVLVGLPGSGKSTFAKALEASGRWSRICQDECGSRGAAETAFSSAMLRGPASSSTSSSDGWWKPHVVLDRCSPDMADRKEWLKLAMVGKRDKGIVAVFFDVDPAICKARVAARTDHPTIPQGRGGRVVDSFLTRLQPPSTNEGFERVYIIRDPRDAAALLTSWGAAAGGIAERQDGATGAAVQEATEGEY
ncbi:hypothetical protein Vretimale_17378 [Volvox reticuliferus]|nr:hypothetical protein Vretifemale_42 [Volvox reticuliferus]GIM14412.1 hypothetical protein Vretimale_17378 [Volvox reticuliferus]